MQPTCLSTLVTIPTDLIAELTIHFQNQVWCHLGDSWWVQVNTARGDYTKVSIARMKSSVKD